MLQVADRTMDAKFQRSETVVGAMVGDDELAMLNVEAGRYFSTRSVGRRLWELLTEPRSIAELCAIICAEFDVDVQTCEADVAEFLDDLNRHGLLRASPA